MSKSLVHYILFRILTAFNEEEALPKLFKEIKTDLNRWINLELIIVNDGSSDRTFEIMQQLQEQEFTLTATQLIQLMHITCG